MPRTLRFAFGAAVTAAALSLPASALGGWSGPMVRGDDGSVHSNVNAMSVIYLRQPRVALVRGSTLVVIDGRVVKTAGAPVHIRTVGTTTFITFAKAGVYRFRNGTLTFRVTVSTRSPI